MPKRYLSAKIYDPSGTDHPPGWADALSEVMVTRYANQLAVEYQSDPDGDGRTWEVHIAIDEPMVRALNRCFQELRVGSVSTIDPNTDDG